MKNGTTILWVQSSCPSDSDIFFVDGKQILPNTDNWQYLVSDILDIKNYGIQLVDSEHTRIYKHGKSYTVQGVLSEKDIHNRSRTFTIRINVHSEKDIHSTIQHELNVHNLHLTHNCDYDIVQFSKRILSLRIIFYIISIIAIASLLFFIA